MTYEFYCDPEDGGCGEVTAISCRFEEKADNTPKSCQHCRKRKALRELFGYGAGTHIPKTVGSRADKNSDKMSEDEKHHIIEKNNEYRDKSLEPSWVDVGGGRMVNTRGRDE